MPRALRSRTSWLLCLASIIGVGILSRVVHTGIMLFDKFLGDALYAAMIYTILRLLWPTAKVALAAMLLMTAIELFQLTRIPADLLTSDHLITRIVGRLLGTEFSFLDLLAYAVGIGCIYAADASRHSIPAS